MSEDSGRRACGRYADDLSAFADHTLPERKWQQIGYHVAGCDACRDEVEQIKRVCSTLSGACAGAASAPQPLAARLAGIAGEDPDKPLYMVAGPPAGLPSARRDRFRMMSMGGAAAVGVLASILILALLVSPDLPVVADPVHKAREDFSLSTTAISVNEAIGAVLLAHERGAQPSEPVQRRARATIISSPVQLSTEAAYTMLSGGRTVDLTYSGVQRVWISNGEGAFHVSDVRIDDVAGEGARLEVRDGNGDTFSAWFVPTSACCDAQGPTDWTFHRYRGLDQVAGRWAQVLEARDADGFRVARWWVDSANGLLLWSERYDTTGAPTLISGFMELELDEANLAHEGAELILINTAGGSESGDKWCVGFDTCRSTLAGLPLVAHASSQAGGRTTMRLVYSDGIRAISACWTEGVLEEGQTATVLDDVPGLPEVAVWQAGDGVISVATNGGLAVLHEATAELPAERSGEVSLFERLRRGLARLSGIN